MKDGSLFGKLLQNKSTPILKCYIKANGRSVTVVGIIAYGDVKRRLAARGTRSLYLVVANVLHLEGQTRNQIDYIILITAV